MRANFADTNNLVTRHSDLILELMNFTLTPGMYVALNQLSKASRRKVLDAAFAFVIEGIRPTNLSKNLLVMFMMVVDSATDGKVTYTPDAEQVKEVQEPKDSPAEIKAAEQTVAANSAENQCTAHNNPLAKDCRNIPALANVKVKMRKRRRNKKTAGL